MAGSRRVSIGEKRAVAVRLPSCEVVILPVDDGLGTSDPAGSTSSSSEEAGHGVGVVGVGLLVVVLKPANSGDEKRAVVAAAVKDVMNTVVMLGKV